MHTHTTLSSLKNRMIVLLLTSLIISGCFGQLDVCGRPPLNTRIVGGQDAPAGSWPWQASVHLFSSHICGGSLINEQWVLSAAYCFLSVSAKDLVVYLGRQNQSGSDPNEAKMMVTRIINHANFSHSTLENNIALLQLSVPVSFTSYIRPVCLAANGSVFPGGVASWVTGWGNTAKEESSPSPGLRQVQVAVIENTQCDSVYGGGLNKDHMICADVRAGVKGFCQGHLGGPLVSLQDTVWVQLGVVIFGNSCDQPKNPGVYTRVSRYHTWINDQITSNKPGFVRFTGTPPATTPPSLTSATPGIDAPVPAATTSATTTSTPQGGQCQPQPQDKIAVPMVTAACLVKTPSASSDLHQLKIVITEKIEKSSKTYYADGLYKSTDVLKMSQGLENNLEVEVKQYFKLSLDNSICFPHKETVMKVLNETLNPHFVQISNISIEDSACIMVTFQTDVHFEEALYDRDSEEFKNLERRIVEVIDHVTTDKYGILYKRTIVLGFRPKQTGRRTKRTVMETEVDLQGEFDPASTSSVSSDSSPNFPRRSDVKEILKKAAANSTLGFTVDVESVSITEPELARARTGRPDATGALCLTVFSLLISQICSVH